MPSSFPRSIAMALAVVPLVVVLSLTTLAIGCADHSGQRPAAVTSTLPPEALDVAPTEEPTVQAQPDEPTSGIDPDPPEPAPEQPPENRASCNAIRGTDYRSLEEREWYGANCGRIPSVTTAASPAPASVAAVAKPSGGQSPAGDRLIIPAAGVDTEVWRVSVPASGVMPDPTGYFNALWYDFSSFGPGLGGSLDAGNLVMSGHVDCGKCYNGGAGAAVFWSVRNLKPGDTAQYRAIDGRVVNYVVTSSHSLAGGTDGASLVASDAADMTLITCTGTFSGGEYSLRHVVTLRKA